MVSANTRPLNHIKTATAFFQTIPHWPWVYYQRFQCGNEIPSRQNLMAPGGVASSIVWWLAMHSFWHSGMKVHITRVQGLILSSVSVRGFAYCPRGCPPVCAYLSSYIRWFEDWHQLPLGVSIGLVYRAGDSPDLHSDLLMHWKMNEQVNSCDLSPMSLLVNQMTFFHSRSWWESKWN